VKKNDSVMFRESYQLLLSVGVSKYKAIELANIHTFKQIYNMVEYAKQTGRNPGGMIIDGLRKNWTVPNALTTEIQATLKKQCNNSENSFSKEERMKRLAERVEEMKRRDAVNRKRGNFICQK
jgi:hypothetical protein